MEHQDVVGQSSCLKALAQSAVVEEGAGLLLLPLALAYRQASHLIHRPVHRARGEPRKWQAFLILFSAAGKMSGLILQQHGVMRLSLRGQAGGSKGQFPRELGRRPLLAQAVVVCKTLDKLMVLLRASSSALALIALPNTP